MRILDCKERLRAFAPLHMAALALMAIAVAVLPQRSAGQVSTTTVQGTVYRADGTPATGTLLLSWSAFTTPQNQAVAAGNLSAAIGADGFLSVSLTPNTAALPTGSYYTATYHLNDGTVNQEYWVVPASATASIASVRAQLEPSTIAVQPVSQAYVDSAISSLGTSWLPLAGGTLSGPLVLSADPSSSSQAATKHYADELAAGELPLTGGDVNGLIATQNSINKLPRVDITHPDFGVGCSNPADRTGVNDSTCAIKNAISYIQSQCVLNACPALYVPFGTFKVSSALRIPSNISVIGDGPQASVLQTTSPTANLITYTTIGTGLAPFFGGVVRNITLSGSGHTTMGTLLEEQGDPLSLEHVQFYNHGGRGFVGYENTERSKLDDVQFESVRWPEIIGGYEYRQTNLTISSPGCDASNYCFGLNDINGVTPGALPSAHYTLVSATGSGSSAAFVFSGSQSGWAAGTSPLAVGNVLGIAGIPDVTGLNSSGLYSATYASGGSPSGTGTVTLSSFNNGCTNSTAVMNVNGGTVGAIAALMPGTGCTAAPTSATCASGTATCSGTVTLTSTLTTQGWVVTNVANNSPVSGEFTLTTGATPLGQAMSATGSGTVSGATFSTVLLPDNRHAAVWVGAGSNRSFIGGEIKPTAHLPAFKFIVGWSDEISNFYVEGYAPTPVNPGLLYGGLPDQMIGNGTLQASSASACTSGGYPCIPVTAATAQWWPLVVGQSSDLPTMTQGGTVANVYIFCSDFNPASTAPCAANSSVQQKQYEIAAVFVANDTGLAYLVQRNLSGSTAPSNTAWVNPVFELPGADGGALGTALTLRKNSWISDNGSGLPSGYSIYQADASIYEPAEMHSFMADGYIPYCGGWGPGESSFSYCGGVPATAGISFADQLGFVPVEATGAGYIKNDAEMGIGSPNNGATNTSATQLSSPGQPPVKTGLATLYTTSPYGVTTESSATGQFGNASAAGPGSNNSPYYHQTVIAANPAGIGNNPGSSGLFAGEQFNDSWCDTDIGTWNGSTGHSQSRFCVRSSTNSQGAGIEWDTWNGSIWSPSWSASGNGISTGSLRTQGAVTGATINSEFTVDGLAYTTLNGAWTAAQNLATSTGQSQTVRLGPGTYPVTATLNEPSNGACVNLLGSAGTTLTADSTQIATTITVPSALNGDVVFLGNTAQAQGCTFKDLNILAGGNATHGFELQWFRGVLLDNVTVNDTTAEGILLGEENTASGHQANFTLRNVTVSYSSSTFTPANRSAYGVHLQKTAIDSYLDNVIVRNALTAAVYNEGTGNTGYLIHGFGYPYTCTTAPCVNNAASGSAANASYATSYVVYDTGGSGSTWTDTYADSPSVAGFYIGGNGTEIHGGHIQWPDTTSFPAANFAYVAASVTNNLLIADVDCLTMSNAANWITFAGTAGNPPTFASIHHLTGCGNYYQSLEDAEVTGFSSGGANVNDASGATPRVWSTPVSSGSNYPAYAAQMYTGDQGDAFQAHFSGANPFFNITYQGTIRSSGGIALNTVINTASTLTLTSANKNVVANAASGAQTLTLPSCYTPLLDKASPTGLEFTIIKSDTSSNTVTLATTGSQLIYSQGTSATSFVISSPSAQTLVCGPDYNWYVTASSSATVSGNSVASFNGRTGAVIPTTNDYSFAQLSGQATNAQLPATLTAATTGNATTATALAATPSGCAAGSYATGVSANGTAVCSTSWHFTWTPMIMGSFGSSTTTALGGAWEPSASIKLTRMDVFLGTTMAGCTTFPTIGVYDYTASAWIATATLNYNATSHFYNAASGTVPAGHNIGIGVQTADAGCTTQPAYPQITVEYTMNQ